MAYLEYDPKNTLYQFTSLEGFKGIVQSGQLWFSDLRSMNDPREIVMGLGRIRPLLQEIVARNKESWNADLCKSAMDRTFQTVKNSDYYTCCFTGVGDSMPLWRHYGQDGAGLALGFRPRALRDLPCRIQRVEYVNDRSPVEDLEVALTEVFERYAGHKGTESLENEIAISTTIISLATAAKHSTWDHEREIRGVYSQSKVKESVEFVQGVTFEMPDGRAVKWQEPTVRRSSNGDVRYIPFKFGKYSNGAFDPSGAISEVIVGSKAGISVPEVKDYLSSEGYRGFEVYSSECIWN